MTPLSLQSVKQLEASGDFVSAADEAMRLIVKQRGMPEAAYLAVRCMARAGAARRAKALYETLNLQIDPDPDVQALAARIEKDLALRCQGEVRINALVNAARKYAQVFEHSGGFYPAVNAATLYELAGHHQEAVRLATTALVAIESLTTVTDDGLNRYYREASRAEALIILNRTDDLVASMDTLSALTKNNYAAHAATRKQLKLLLHSRDLDDSLLLPLTNPSVAHYSGHMMTPATEYAEGGFSEPQVQDRIATALEQSKPGFLFGSLACGSDILFAEAGIAAGMEINVTLPFAVDAFIRNSVLPGGEVWVTRFQNCLARATTVAFASDDPLSEDEQMYGYASRLAMGQALLRARALDTYIFQIAVWDGRPASAAGAGYDVTTWQSLGHPSEIISVERRQTNPPAYKSADAVVASGGSQSGSDATPNGQLYDGRFSRRICALLFADLKGFSALQEASLPVFNNAFMGSAAAVIDRHRSDVLHRNTWGDAIFLVADSAVKLAQIALELQEAAAAFDNSVAGMGEADGFRISLHYGPVFVGPNAITHSTDYFGSHVTRAARTEPITPVGEVYATDAFAAAMALDGYDDISVEYIGKVPTAKNHGTFRMFHIHRNFGN